ncbi:MAG: DUF433 domain-containing protein [Microcystaceae cyanobacterium]
MTLAILAETAPLTINSDGVVCVGKTRVTLDTVIAVFKQGVTAEEIIYRYPSLHLKEVYAVIAFYLNHKYDVELYLQKRQQKIQEIRRQNQIKFNSQALQERLIARKIDSKDD